MIDITDGKCDMQSFALKNFVDVRIYMAIGEFTQY